MAVGAIPTYVGAIPTYVGEPAGTVGSPPVCIEVTPIGGERLPMREESSATGILGMKGTVSEHAAAKDLPGLWQTLEKLPREP
jgi:hypothetical protein